MSMKTLLITGGCGFIGSNFILNTISSNSIDIINLDKLTYAAHPFNLSTVENSIHYRFIKGDIGDRALTLEILQKYKPDSIINFAAESHVDRSIHNPIDFIETNVVGTFNLLESTKSYWEKLPSSKQTSFKFIHISTDEVYGSLGPSDPAFNETTPYAPNSPYAASKAASDHLVRSFYHTYGLPIIITHCSNNYGPYQFPEKLIPLMITNALEGKPLPVYGDGLNIRDWIHVADHCLALRLVLDNGQAGETYDIGSREEKTNIEVVNTLCYLLDELIPDSPYKPHQSLISYIKDRLGHDRRYAINPNKIEKKLGWKPNYTFEQGIKQTVHWYLNNLNWVQLGRGSHFQDWIKKNYANAN